MVLNAENRRQLAVVALPRPCGPDQASSSRGRGKLMLRSLQIQARMLAPHPTGSTLPVFLPLVTLWYRRVRRRVPQGAIAVCLLLICLPSSNRPCNPSKTKRGWRTWRRILCWSTRPSALGTSSSHPALPCLGCTRWGRKLAKKPFKLKSSNVARPPFTWRRRISVNLNLRLRSFCSRSPRKLWGFMPRSWTSKLKWLAWRKRGSDCRRKQPSLRRSDHIVLDLVLQDKGEVLFYWPRPCRIEEMEDFNWELFCPWPWRSHTRGRLTKNHTIPNLGVSNPRERFAYWPRPCRIEAREGFNWEAYCSRPWRSHARGRLTKNHTIPNLGVSNPKERFAFTDPILPYRGKGGF